MKYKKENKDRMTHNKKSEINIPKSINISPLVKEGLSFHINSKIFKTITFLFSSENSIQKEEVEVHSEIKNEIKFTSGKRKRRISNEVIKKKIKILPLEKSIVINSNNSQSGLMSSNSKSIVIKKSILDFEENSNNKITLNKINNNYDVIEISKIAAGLKDSFLGSSLAKQASNKISKENNDPKFWLNFISPAKNKSKFNSDKQMNILVPKHVLRNEEYSIFNEDLSFQNLKLSESFENHKNIDIDAEKIRSANVGRTESNSIQSFNTGRDQEFVFEFIYKNFKGLESTITLYDDDLHKLDPTVYLNDNIVLFYLRYKYLFKLFLLRFLEHNVVSKDLLGKFIIFNTFFYSTLGKDEDGCFDSPLKNYNSIKNWTKKLKIFEADFIIIPINENNEHWSLLIVLYPGKMKKIFDDHAQKEEQETEIDITEFPGIVYFDSFYSDNIRCVNIFKKYLFYEYASKQQNVKNNFDYVEYIRENHHKITSYVPDVPKQNNTYDCGIYLLAYSELFLLEPEFVINRLKEYYRYGINLADWFDEKFIINKRDDIRKLLIALFNISSRCKALTQAEQKDRIVQKFKLERDELLKSCYKQRYIKEPDRFNKNFDV